MKKIDKKEYISMYGPTTGDKVRLGDTDLFIEVEKDFTTYGDEMKFGGGKTIRDGMGQKSDITNAGGALDTLITNALITYAQGTPHTSTVSMEYGDFVPMGSKRFPSREKVTFQTKAMNTGKLSLELKLNKITNDTDWESRTTVSDKYRKISAQQFFSKLGNM